MTTVAYEIAEHELPPVHDSIEFAASVAVENAVEFGERTRERMERIGEFVGSVAAEASTGVNKLLSQASIKFFTKIGNPGVTFMTKYTVEQRGMIISSAEAYNSYRLSLR